MSVFTKTIIVAAAALALSYSLGQFKSQSVYTEIIIDAPTEVVWAELVNTDEYESWNPFIKDFKGEIEVGNQLDVTIQLPGNPAMRFYPTVLKSTKNRELRWIGHLGFKGVLDGEHFFKLEKQEDGTTRFRQGETFTGMLSDLFFVYAEEETTRGFEAMNAALKYRSETKS